ncbi:MAG: sulfatase-like hydrolase/transferase [Planctomycetaceae bacterium]
MRLLTGLCFIVLSLPADQIAANDRPNVVILLADDLGSKDIGCYGGPVKTPVLDRLASEGVRFTHFYSGAAVCSPARAALLTGRQHMRTGVYTVIQDHMHDMHLLNREVTIAEHLKSNGYQTVHVGKWHLGTPFRGRKKPWIDEHGFDHWFATDLNAAPSHRNPVNFWRNRKRVGKLEGYACQIVVDEAISWLDTKRDAKKPFFLNVWFHEPHAPLAAPPEIVSQYGEPNDPAAIYSATIDNTDRAIGRLVKKLEDIGQLDDTIIFYTSDHGSYRPERNGGLTGNKGSLFEGGIRTPGIFFWPNGIKRGQTEPTPGAAIDLLPTLCGLTGIDLPQNVKLDGTDLSPVLLRSGSLQDVRPKARPVGTVKRINPLAWISPTAQPALVIRDNRFALVARRGMEYPKDQKKIAEIMAAMERIIAEELDLDRKLTRSELWQKCYNFECNRSDWRKLRSQFVTLNSFQEAWCPLIKSGSGGLKGLTLYDLKNDPNQKQNVANRFPLQFEKLKERAVALHREVLDEAVDWSDPDSVATARRETSIEKAMAVHRLTSKNRSIYDAFAYVNRLPEEPFSDESAEDFAARVSSRLANQEGRILLKVPPGMTARAFNGYRIFMQFQGDSAVGNCVACHTPQSFTDGKRHIVSPDGLPKRTPSLRNLNDVDLTAVIKTKLAIAKKKQSVTAPDVSAAYDSIRLNDQNTADLVEFLNLLRDGPNKKFRELILQSKVMDITP